ncbi:MAG: FAD-binding oxidoreductase [Thermodesulfobacteriota bacterium]|nr:FAD-binding oxidoreductase [Thermodesulfobacteriota bacterium]
MSEDRIYKLIEKIVGPENVSNEPYSLECYARDSTTNSPSLPSYIAMATTVEQIQGLVRLANKEKIPIIPAVGMSNTGGLTIPVEGGIILDLHRMDKIIEINRDIDYAIVEPGVTIGQIDTELKKIGYWVSLPVGPPGSAGLLPGYILHGYGHLGGKFGINSEQITGAEVVLPDGELVKLGGGAVSPYWFHRTPIPDLLGLVLGWQGTTGIVTKLSINIYQRPKFKDAVGWGIFTSHDDPLPESCARFLLKIGRSELAYDISGHSWGAVQIGKGLKYPLAPKPKGDPELYFAATTYAFTEEELVLKKKIIERMIKEGIDSGLPFDFTDVTGRIKVEMPTKYALKYSDHRGGGGLDYIGSITPVINWSQGIKRLNEIFDKFNFTPYIRLSIYRGTLQGMMRALMPYNRGDKKDVEAVQKMARDVVQVILDCGGLIYKAPSFASEEMWKRGDPNFFKLMKLVKQTLDPNRIMNPGRLGL